MKIKKGEEMKLSRCLRCKGMGWVYLCEDSTGTALDCPVCHGEGFILEQRREINHWVVGCVQK